jgi:signal transduction histidine kinase
MTRPLRLVAAATASLTAGAVLLRLANPLGLPVPAPAAAVPGLLALASVIAVVLVAGWAPTLAWVTIVAGSISASVSVTAITDVALKQHAAPMALLQAVLVAALLIPPATAGAYAVLASRRQIIIATAWLVVASLTTELVFRAMARTGGAEVRGGLPRWAWLGLIAGLTALGLVRDLAPVLRRTRARLARERAERQLADSRPGANQGGVAGALPALRVLIDELVPGRDIGRVQAVETERGRLAADLHAQVLPSLHRALAEAESGGSVERLAADLRSAVDDVESLLVARRSIVLEEMGLLAGLEWLAERIEDRSAIRVEIEVLGTVPSDVSNGASGTARPPRDVERAAFRIAQLALDNVLRHARARRAQVSVDISPRAVAMTIGDDGDGPTMDEAAAARSGRRGIADMRAEAGACGGTLTTGRDPAGSGMVVAFGWSA